MSLFYMAYEFQIEPWLGGGEGCDSTKAEHQQANVKVLKVEN